MLLCVLNTFMISFQDYMKKIEEDRFDVKYDPRTKIEDTIAILSHMEPKDIEDCKDLLLELQKMLEVILSGGE